MAPGIVLIAGLGNPGAEYADTRHNAGFRFLDALLADASVGLKGEPRFSARVARATIAGHEIWVLAPATYMNHSGEALVRFALYHKILPSQILVVHDDLDLPPGSVRLKLGGGDGGHNGLKDIAARLGSTDFARLRLGVGRPAGREDVVGYVLRRAPAAEQELIDSAIDIALAHLPDIVHGHYQKVMNSLHTHKVGR